MDMLESIHEFKALKDRILADRNPETPTIIINAGTCGQASGANDLIRIAKRELLHWGLVERINLRITGCHGYCEMEPSVLIEPHGTYYPKIGQKEMVRIIRAVSGEYVIENLLFTDPATGNKIEKQNDIPFFKKQHRPILSMSEKVDPIRIYNYIEAGGYGSLASVLGEKEPIKVIEEVKEAGIRGRGGAGFPTGRKWELLAREDGSRGKVLVCNADEGDPGAYMDRALLEGNPHSIIEGMIIGAYATGATNGIVYVRNEYPLAIKHLVIALRQARDLGLLGVNILGTGFSFDIEMVRGAGAFVCGEETALIHSIEGKMGEPRQRPPYPITKGVFGKPTAINNVETWANIPVIFRMGASEYAKTGTPGNTGTKIFSLVGKIKNTGLVEVPMGITINEIVYDIGGGPVGDAKIKAVQTGGPSGGCIPASKFDLQIDYDSLADAGSIMGSGGMIVMDENTCMVDVAKYFMSFLKDESCGKCFTCRKGTQRMWEILDDITTGKGVLEHIDLLEEIALVVKDTTMCGLGQSAPNPVLSTLRYFRSEYERHIVAKRCDAYVCRDLVGAPCQAACPLGTEAWRYVAHIARGEYKDAYRAIRLSNPFPSVCARVCSHPCEEHCRSGQLGADPVAIRSLKRFITDRIDPSTFVPERRAIAGSKQASVAIVGAGPSGLTAAHYLSLMGYSVTVYESDNEPGGMLNSAIPSYRLPKTTLRKEVESILDSNISLKCGKTLGRDFTLGELFREGHSAVFIAIGAHKSKGLGEGMDDELEGVISALTYLKRFNLEGANLAKGNVGVIGGGDSAVDAARVARRQPEVESVTIYYRRTREEMPAFKEEIEAALAEGIKLETLVSPVSLEGSENGKGNGKSKGSGMKRLAAVNFVRNKLGEMDASGRRRPVPIVGSDFSVKLDSLLVAIGDEPDSDALAGAGVEIGKAGVIAVDLATLSTNIPGVFAGGDAVRGPNTVVEAIADGKKAAAVIDRYIRGVELTVPAEVKLPSVYVAPVEIDEEEDGGRQKPPVLSAERRVSSFMEVEGAYEPDCAKLEAKRCLRCDLDFTRPTPAADEEDALLQTVEKV